MKRLRFQPVHRHSSLRKELMQERANLQAATIICRAEETKENSPHREPVPLLPLLGERRVAVVLVNTQNEKLSFGPSDARESFFGDGHSVRKMFEEASYGQFTISGDVFGPFTISSIVPGLGECGGYTAVYSERADKELEAAEVNLSAYHHIFYLFASMDSQSCRIGAGELNGRRSWVSETKRNSSNGHSLVDQTDFFAHELGHNFGLMHANNSRYLDIYGDAGDVMGIGGGGLRNLNAPHRIQLGWIPSENLQTVSTEGDYTITSLDAPVSAIQALVINQPGTTRKIYISYRNDLNFDEDNPYHYPDVYGIPYRHRTSVHSWNPSGEMIYNGCISPLDTKLHGTLTNREELVVPESGVAIRQLSHGTSTSSVHVRFFQPTDPDSTYPTVAILSPAEGGAVSGITPIEVLASDDVGIGSVTLVAGYKIVGTDNQAPYIFNVDFSEIYNGTYSIGAFVHDTSGNFVSTWQLVNVDNPMAIEKFVTAPSGLRATTSGDGIRLRWFPSRVTPSTALIMYVITRTLVGDPGSTETFVSVYPRYADRDVEVGQTYEYTIKAISPPTYQLAISEPLRVTMPGS